MRIELVGVGRVGQALAPLLLMLEPEALGIIDVVRERAQGVCEELRHVLALMHEDVEVYWDTQPRGGDLAIITAGKPRKEGMKREHLLLENFQILKSLLKNSMDWESIFIVTNPVDVLVNLASDFHDNVFGLGTALDTMRFRTALEQRLGLLKPKAYVLGEHATEFMVPVWVDGNDRIFVSEKAKREVEEEVRKGGERILKLLGGSSLGPAYATFIIVRALHFGGSASISMDFYDEDRDLYWSMPVNIEEGYVEPLSLPLDENEQKGIEKAIEHIKTLVEKVRK